MSTTTYLPKPGEVQRNWLVVDATDQVLGRLASKLAFILQGKNKPTYAPNVDVGDFIIVINAEKVRVTGKKAEQLSMETYSKYPSGRHLYSLRDMLEQHPEKVIEVATRRMLPKNRIGRAMLTKLNIYKGDKHPHSAQMPKPLKLA